MKKYKSLISMCALATLANCAKADIISAQEHRDEEKNIKSIVINNPTAKIGTVKTPWMFVRPDGKSGFANDFTTNAISVVSENGIDYYAHIEGEDGDRTKVIKFTVDNGFPSTHGEVINVTNCPSVSAEEMKTRKLVGVANGTLCFYPTEGYGTSLLYNPQLNEVFSDKINENLVGTITQKCLASCQDESTVYVLCNVKCELNGWTGTETYIKRLTGFDVEYTPIYFFPEKNEENKDITYCMARHNDKFCIGDSEGNVDFISDGTFFSGIFPGPVSSITMSKNGVDVFVTSTATNAFCNVGLHNIGSNDPLYNAVSIDGVSQTAVKSVVPKMTNGIVRIIDNRHNNGGKLLCVTPKGIHSIDD